MANWQVPELPTGKLNAWCERRPLVCRDEARIERAYRFGLRHDLSSAEQSAYFLHELTGSPGLEFVAFSNARLEGPVTLGDGITLVPCFETDWDHADPQAELTRLTMIMFRVHRFVYDGWLPIDAWDEANVRRSIRSIDEALSTFALRASAYFEWDVKYRPRDGSSGAAIFGDAELRDMERIAGSLSSLDDRDRDAVLRSVAWLSQGIRLVEPAARFLFFILAIESLATYIESESEDASAFRTLRTFRGTRAQRRRARDECIRETIAQRLSDNPTEAVERAYFDCVTGVRTRLRDHLSKVFAGPETIRLLFDEKTDGLSLYDIRNRIAHGSFDAISESQREQVRIRAGRVHDIAKYYIINVLSRTARLKRIDPNERFSLHIGFENGVATHEGMVQGPTHMAQIYS